MKHVIRNVALLLAAPALLAGCGMTRIRQPHILQSYDSQGRIGYYKVEVEGDVKLAKTSFRSGLYDAEAVDALFSSVSQDDNSSVSNALDRQRREAVSTLAASYYKALGSAASSKMIRAYEDRLAYAMRSPYEVKSVDDLLGPTQPHRKYVIIMSAKASEIEEAIAAFTEEKETTDVVLTAISSIKREEYIKTNVERENIERAMDVLRAVRTELTTLQPLPANASAEERKNRIQKVNDLLQVIAGTEVP